MKLSELILAVGDDKVGIQNLDSCAISLDYGSKRGTHITFGTDQPLTPNGTAKLGMVVWLDREAVKSALAAKASPAPEQPTLTESTDALTIGGKREQPDGSFK